MTKKTRWKIDPTMKARIAPAAVRPRGRIADWLMYRHHPRHRSPAWHQWMNLALAPLRGQIEKVVGVIKRRLRSLT